MYLKNLTTLKIKLFAFAILVSISSCEVPWDCTQGHGPTVSRQLSLEEINGISLMGSDKVYISTGQEQEIIVEGQQNIIHELNTNVRNGNWEIRFRDCVRDNRGLKIYITVKNINEIELAGSGEIFMENVITEDFLALAVAGSGEVSGEIRARSLDIEIAGSGNLDISGSAADAELYIAGSGKLRAYDLIVDNYQVEIAGSGNADITALETLEVNIAGSGSVNYKGNPFIDSNISSSGKILNKN